MLCELKLAPSASGSLHTYPAHNSHDPSSSIIIEDHCKIRGGLGPRYRWKESDPRSGDNKSNRNWFKPHRSQTPLS